MPDLVPHDRGGGARGQAGKIRHRLLSRRLAKRNRSQFKRNEADSNLEMIAGKFLNA